MPRAFCVTAVAQPLPSPAGNVQPGSVSGGSVQRHATQAILAVLPALEGFGDLGMAHRFARLVGQQVLLRDIGDIFGFGVFRIEVVERLFLVWTDVLGDRQPPFLGIRKDRVDVIDDAPKRIFAMPDDLADTEFC